MIEVTDRADVERILEDPAHLVPEADAAATRPWERLRARASRFVNGPVHDLRRGRLEAVLDGVPPEALANAASARARSMLPADADELAVHVPVATLAGLLGFAEPDAAPELVAVLAEHYPAGSWSAAADDAATRLLAAAPTAGGSGGDVDDDGLEAALLVQLLVQAHAATAALISGALNLPAAADRSVPTSDLLAMTLRDAPPVRRTRRVSPASEPLVLHLDGPDRRAGDGSPRTLAFGAGPRACPARAHALAIAGAVVGEVRSC